MKRIIRLLMFSLGVVLILHGCTIASEESSQVNKDIEVTKTKDSGEGDAEGESNVDVDAEMEAASKDSTDTNTNTNPIQENDKGGTQGSDVLGEEEQAKLQSLYQEFDVIYEAEEAILKGRTVKGSSKAGFSKEGYVDGFQNDGDGVEFIIQVPMNGFYDFNFYSASYDGYKENNIVVDNVKIGTVSVDTKEFSDSIITKIYLEKGEHRVAIKKYWGWIYLDYLRVTPSKKTDEIVFKVKKELINKNADDNTKRLMSYLVDVYGKYTLSGQNAEKGRYSSEIFSIQQASGKLPAILGLDLIEYSPSRVLNGSKSKAVEYAIEYDSLGGIISLCWHWNAPKKYLTTKEPWWRGFYTEASTINLRDIMSKKDKEGYELLLSDIDEIAIQLKRLEEAGVPILFRPLHEASGGWFWWGASGPEAYKELWKLLYDRITNHHNINNLIWVWNGQNKDWYPGDDYADIIGEDIYPGEKVYSSQVAKFNEALDYTDNKKIIAMTENGCLFDPDLAYRDDARWAWFTTWSGEFVVNTFGALSEKYTEEYMVKHVYNHEKVITLDELPNLKTYSIK